MVSARHGIVLPEFAHDRVQTFWDGIDRFGREALGQHRTAVFKILPALLAECVEHFAALFGGHGILPAVADDAAHVVHARGGDGLDAVVDLRRLEGECAAAADADGADPVSVHEGTRAQEVHACAEVLGEDLGRGDVPGLAAAFAVEGFVKGDGHEAALGHGLRIDARALFLDAAVGGAHDEGRMFFGCVDIFRQVHVGRQRDAVPVGVRNLFVRHLVAQFECLVPVHGVLRAGRVGNQDQSQHCHHGRHHCGHKRLGFHCGLLQFVDDNHLR